MDRHVLHMEMTRDLNPLLGNPCPPPGFGPATRLRINGGRNEALRNFFAESRMLDKINFPECVR